MDVGSIEFGIDARTSQLRDADAAVDSFGESAERAERNIHETGDAAQKAGRQGKRAGRDMSRGMRDASESSERLRTAITGIGTVLAAVGGAAVFRGITSQIADFEESMLGLQAVSGSTSEQMKELEDQARTLGATSRYAAEQAAQGQRFLAQAGFSVNEIMEATPGVMDLATAGQMSLANSADIASNALGQFQLPVEELSRVNDVLAASASSSNTNVQQLAGAMNRAGPVATSAGVSIEETAAAIGTLSDSGVQASRAGTGFLAIVRQLSNMTPEAQETLQSYGITMEDTSLQANSLSEVLGTLRDANISTTDAFKIFQSEGFAASQILSSGASRVGEFTGELENSEGALDRMANILGKGLANSMRAFRSAMSEAVLQLGDNGLGGGLQYVFDTAAGVINVYNGMTSEFAEANNLTDEQTGNLTALARSLQGTAGAIGAVTAAYVTLQGVLYGVSAAQRVFNAAVNANPYVLGATVLAAAIGALYSLRSATVSIGDTTAQVGDYMQAAWELVTGAISDTLDAIAGPLTSAIQSVSGEFQSTSKNSAGFWATAMDSIMIAGRATINGLIGLFKGLASAIAEIVYNISDNMTTAFVGVADAASAAMSGNWSGVKEALNRDLVNPLNGVMEAFVAQQKDYLGEWGEALTNRVERNTQEFGTFGEYLFDINRESERLSESAIQAAKAVANLSSETNKSGGELEESAKAASQFNDSLRDLLDTLFPVQQAQRQYLQDQMALQTAFVSGRISAERYFQALQRLNEAQKSGENWQDVYGFDGSGAKNVSDVSSAARDLGMTFESAFESAIIEGNSFREVLGGIAEDIARIALRKSITEPASNWLTSAFQIGASASAGSAGGGTYMGGTTGGLYADGGYTGDGGTNDPAGIVHKGEFVVRKDVVGNPGVRPMLESLNKNGYASGGYVGGSTSNSYSSNDNRSPTVEVNTPVYVQAQQGSNQGDAQRQGKAIGQQVQGIVMQTLMREKRPGGILSEDR